MPGPDGEECKGCYYMELSDHNNDECRKKSVTLKGWPPCPTYGWCGEYRHRNPCPKCRGKGIEFTAGNMSMEARKCPRCNGTGKAVTSQD